MGQHPTSDTGPEAEARQDEVRRLSGACFLLGAFGTAITVYLGGLLTDRPSALFIPILFAVMNGVVCLTFPWRRYDPRWFVLMCLPANLVIAASAAVSGGLGSPVSGFFYVVVAIAGAYRGGWLLVAQVLFTAGMVVAVAALDGTTPPAGTLAAHGIVELLALTAVALAVRTAVARGIMRREEP